MITFARAGQPSAAADPSSSRVAAVRVAMPMTTCIPGGLSMTVPWAIGGARLEPGGSIRQYPGDWPSLALSGLRLWDTRTAWLNIEPADDDWQFDRLDAYLAKAQRNGVTQVTMVLAGTPTWAAAHVTAGEAPWLGAGSASPPRDLRQWRAFVRAVATRYAGRIHAYEVWNEPNSRTFFTGTPAQWASLVSIAVQEIRTIDPTAIILASGFAMNSASDLRKAGPWLEALSRIGRKPDVLSLHWYPNSCAQLGGLASIAQRLRARSEELGLPSKLWITEVNARVSRGFPGQRQQQVVEALTSQGRATGVQGMTWYAWLDLPTRLMPIRLGTPVTRALHRLQSCNQR